LQRCNYIIGKFNGDRLNVIVKTTAAIDSETLTYKSEISD